MMPPEEDMGIITAIIEQAGFRDFTILVRDKTGNPPTPPLGVPHTLGVL